MPISLQARITRRAISPRLAMRMLWNMHGSREGRRIDTRSTGGVHPEQHLIELHRLPVLDQDLPDDAVAAGGYLVVGLHGLDQTDDGVGGNPSADGDERSRVRVGTGVEGADGRALDVVEVAGRPGLGRGRDRGCGG